VSNEPRTPAPARPPGRQRTPSSARPGATRATAQRRHQPTRHEREERYQRLGLIGAGVIVLIVGVLLGVGWYETYVRPYHATVLTVGKRSADMNDLIDNVNQILPQFASSDAQVVLSVVPSTALSQIEEQFVVLQRASSAGVQVSSQEIDAAIAKNLAVPTDKNGQPLDRRVFEAALRTQLAKSGLTLSQYRDQTESQLLRTKVQDKLTADLPKTVPEVKYSELILNTQDSAQKYLDRLNKGESWDTLAAEIRKDPTIGSVADFDFQPQQQIDAKLSGPLFALKQGGHTDVVNTSDGKFTIAMLVQKDDNHALSADQRSAIGPKLYSNWLAAQKKALKIKESLSDSQKLFAVEHSNFIPTAAAQQQVPPQPAAVPPSVATPPAGAVPPASPAAAGTAAAPAAVSPAAAPASLAASPAAAAPAPAGTAKTGP
jgi:parvulin-like peptidyl-prolyl isomerase